MQSAKKQISLESYIDFLHSRPRIDLPVYDLNQIIRLHGFRKVDRTPKKILAQALEELDLIDLSRSTIDHRSEIFASAPITLEDLVGDLNKLNWQECRVTSVQTLHSSKRGSASTGPAECSFPQSVSKDAGPILNSKAYFTSTVQAADLSSTVLAESKEQSAPTARKTKSLNCLGSSAAGVATKSAAAGELSTGPAESKEVSAAASRKRKSAGRLAASESNAGVVSSLPAHLSIGPAAESKKKQPSAAPKKSR